MPLVVVNRGKQITEGDFCLLTNRLPKIIAGALTCDNPDGKLTQADIEVWVRSADLHDIGSEKLQIVVFAGLYPERLANKVDRKKMIEDEIKKLLPPDIHGWVWVIMAESFFGEF